MQIHQWDKWHSITTKGLPNMTVTLVTGANKGLGYETARQLIERGHTVYIGARSVEGGEAAAAELSGQFVQLEVTDDASVKTALGVIASREDHLDVLVNNAGISTNEEVNGQVALEVFDTNAVGVIRVTQAALPLLRKSENRAGLHRDRPHSPQRSRPAGREGCRGHRAPGHHRQGRPHQHLLRG